MCKRNSPHKNGYPDKNKTSMRCVRETLHMKMTPAWDMCKRNSPDKKERKKKERKPARMFKRNSLHKNQDSTGCVRQTPRIKVKAARDV